MDEASKAQFKLKFTILVILLNLIVLLIAVAIIALFLPLPLSPTIKISIFGILIVAALLLSAYFYRSYGAAKKWLENHQ